MSRYTVDGRLGALEVAYARLLPAFVEAVQKAAVDLSIDATSQLSLTVLDPTLELLGADVLGKRTAVRLAGLTFEVTVRELISVGKVPALKVVCRVAGVQALKRARTPHVWSELSPTRWAALEAAAAGLRFVGEPSAVRRQIVREPTDGAPVAPSSWELLGELATQLGFLMFESEGTLYFGRPSWLLAQFPITPIVWRGRGEVGTTDALLACPQLRDSDDDSRRGFSGSLSVAPALGELLLPARGIDLSGVGPFSGRYLCAGLQMDLDGISPASVPIQTPVDPTPQPPEPTPAAA